MVWQFFSTHFYKQIDEFWMRKTCQIKEVWNIFLEFQICQTFRGKFTWVGQVVANETSKIKIYAKFLVFFIKGTFCSSLFLYNFETYQKLPYKINLLGYKLYPFSCISQYLRTLYGAFSDPQRPGLYEIDPTISKIWHFQTPKMSIFEPRKPTVQCIEFQGADSILKVGFVQSKWPHFHRVY